jgi:hypothetical protein
MARKSGSKFGNSVGGRSPHKTRKARKRQGAKRRAVAAREGLNNDKN